jgi:uncharacterized protein YndB with AHSA1/START domain
MSRHFAAPRALVFAAHTQPELVKRWLGVRAGWVLAVCEIDLRAGGAYRYVWRHEQRALDMGLSGEYLTIDAPERIVCTELFDQAWYPGDAVVTSEFQEDGGSTALTITVLYASAAARDGVLNSGAAQGVADSYDKLAELLLEGWLVE